MAQPKILIVDDEPFNVDYLEQELDEAGCTTFSAGDGQAALDRVQSEPPDLILLDIMMPVMDGFQVLSRLKADPEARDIPVIVISASSDIQSVVRGIQLGAEDFLPKPFEPVLLQARIASSLEKKRLRDLEQLYLKSLEREMNIARDIQRCFLPPALPKVDGWDLAVWFQAAREVAGDYYDAFFLPDGGLAVVIGDVCGKGVGAALFMALFRSLIRATSTTGVFRQGDQPLTPAERLEHVVAFTNRYTVDTHGDDTRFTTVFMGIFDLPSGRLVYANCGNESPLLIEAGGVITELRPTGPVVGALPDVAFGVKEIAVPPGASLLAFTDGIPDALNGEEAAYGSERLRSFLTCGDAPAVLLEKIAADVRRFTGAAPQFDDITMLAIRRGA